MTTPVSLLPAPARHSKNPVFRWDALPGAASYDLWLSNLTTDKRVLLKEGIPGTQTSWTASITLPSAQYRYWLRARDAAGVPANWSIPQSFDVGVSVLQTEISTFEASPVILWTAEPGVNEYEIYVSRSGVLIENSHVTTTSWKSATALPIGTYQFWVRGRLSENGRLAPWSTPVEFNTGGKTVLKSAQATESSLPFLKWLPVDHAEKYRLQVINRTSQTIVLDEQGITTSQYQIQSILPDDTYRVWARAESTTGLLGIWSPPLDFSVNTTSSSVVVVQNLVRWIGDGTPLFQWVGSAGAVSYDFYLASGNRIISQERTTATSWVPALPLATGDWTMWVRARDAQDRTGAWGLPESATVGKAPSLAIVKQPNSSIAEVRWASVYGAVKYEVYIQNLTTNRVTRINGVTLKNYSPAGSLSAGSYRVWVRAISQTSQAGPWSQPADFFVSNQNDRHNSSGLEFDSGNLLAVLKDLVEGSLFECTSKPATSTPRDTDVAEGHDNVVLPNGALPVSDRDANSGFISASVATDARYMDQVFDEFAVVPYAQHSSPG